MDTTNVGQSGPGSNINKVVIPYFLELQASPPDAVECPALDIFEIRGEALG